MNTDFEIIQNDENFLVSLADIRSLQLEELEHLSKEEMHEFRKIHNKKYKEQWLSSRWLAGECKKILKRQHFNIDKRQSGKPFLKNSELHISLSHNPRSAAVMIARNNCGIDIEIFRDKIKRIQHKFLTTEELDRYSDEIEILTLIWSAKESVYKMLEIPGLVFREEMNCNISNLKDQGSIVMRLKRNNMPEAGLLNIQYKIIGNQIMTYTMSADFSQ